jgi:hypothetical protein
MAILSGHNQGNMDWKRILLIFFLVSMWVATIVQCAICSDVVSWSFFMHPMIMHGELTTKKCLIVESVRFHAV